MAKLAFVPAGSVKCLYTAGITLWPSVWLLGFNVEALVSPCALVVFRLGAGFRGMVKVKGMR